MADPSVPWEWDGLDSARWASATGTPSEQDMEPKPGRYRHYKGNDYEVLGVATHSETGEKLVVYRALYGARGLWVRPVGMFGESVTVGEKPVPRFVYLGPA
jgi:hypothetical protein